MYYNDARFDEAIAILNGCLEQGTFDEAEQVPVYTLLSMFCFANRDEADARQAIRVLLSLSPGYQPDPIHSQPSYRALVEDVRDELQPAFPENATLPVLSAVNGHQEIADRTNLAATTKAMRSITEPGQTWSALLPAQPIRQWQRNLARLQKLDELARTVRRLEKQLEKVREND